MEELAEFHPLVVHFPIALTIAAVGFDLLGLATKRENFHVVARWNFLVALTVGLAAFGTGLLAEDEVPSVGIKHDIAERHKFLAIGFLALLGILTLWRFRSHTAFPTKLRWVYALGILATAPLVGITAHQGGTLVFEHGIGTEMRYADHQNEPEVKLEPPPAPPTANGGAKPVPPEETLPIKTRAQNKCIVMPKEDIDPAVSVIHDGVEYFFCCQKCKREFLKNPAKFLK